MYMEPDEILDDRPPRAPRWAARRRCSPSATGRRTRWHEARQWLDERGYDSTLDYVRAMAIRVLEETGLLPHLNPGVMSWEELYAAQAGRAVDGHDAGDHVAAAVRDQGRGALRLARTRTPRYGCACWRTPAGCRSRSPPGSWSASARRWPSGPRRSSRSAQVAQGVRARSGSHRAELPGQARHRDAATPDDRPRRLRRRRSRSPGWCSGPRCASRRRRTWSSRAECLALIGAGVDDWGGVSPLTPDHVNPERPWPAARRARGRHRRGRLRPACSG